MALTKKKSKTPAKKKSKSAAKKVTGRIAKKAAKSPAKKKARPAAAKKAKSPARKKVISAAGRKTKTSAGKKTAKRNKKIESAPKESPVPEVIRQEEVDHSTPAGNEMRAQRVAEIKILEHRFENREDATMNKENQKVKSAMSTRQKKIYRIQRH